MLAIREPWQQTVSSTLRNQLTQYINVIAASQKQAENKFTDDLKIYYYYIKYNSNTDDKEDNTDIRKS